MNVQKWPEIDVLYSLGTILVVFGHSHSSDWSSFAGTVFEQAILFVYTFHMPLFFFIAGFLFANSGSLEKIGYRNWIKQKAERLLTPYLVLSFTALVPKYYIENRGFYGFADYLLKAMLIPRVGVWGHLWFLPVLLLLYIVFGYERCYLVGGAKKTVLEGGGQLSWQLSYTSCRIVHNGLALMTSRKPLSFSYLA